MNRTTRILTSGLAGLTLCSIAVGSPLAAQAATPEPAEAGASASAARDSVQAVDIRLVSAKRGLLTIEITGLMVGESIWSVEANGQEIETRGSYHSSEEVLVPYIEGGKTLISASQRLREGTETSAPTTYVFDDTATELAPATLRGIPNFVADPTHFAATFFGVAGATLQVFDSNGKVIGSGTVSDRDFGLVSVDTHGSTATSPIMTVVQTLGSAKSAPTPFRFEEKELAGDLAAPSLTSLRETGGNAIVEARVTEGATLYMKNVEGRVVSTGHEFDGGRAQTSVRLTGTRTTYELYARKDGVVSPSIIVVVDTDGAREPLLEEPAVEVVTTAGDTAVVTVDATAGSIVTVTNDGGRVLGVKKVGALGTTQLSVPQGADYEATQTIVNLGESLPTAFDATA